MTAPAVSVEAGTSATRLAARGPDGRPELVALPAGISPAAALESLYGDAPVPVVVLVHPPDRDPGEVASAGATLRGLTGAVRTVPSPLAVLAGMQDAAAPAGTEDAGPPAVTAPRLVVVAGASGTEVTVVVAGRVMPSHRVDVGGDRLDAALAAAIDVPPVLARAVREALSLRTDVALPGGDRCEAARCRAVIRPVLAELAAAVAGAARRSGAAEVVLAGGLARTPLLAELLDEAVDVPVRTVEVPEAAAVLGALDVPDPVRDPGPTVERDTTAVHGIDGSPGVPLVRSGRVPEVGHRGTGVPPATRSAAGRRRGWIRSRGAPVAAALGIALVAAGTMAGRVPAAPEPAEGTALVQYGYTMTLPAGWEHTGGLPERRRTLLTRSGSPDGAELIAVERSPLGYDSALEPERTRAELAAEFRRRAAEQDLRDYRDDTVAGRPVLRYRQADPGPVVDWFVLFAGTDELVVGCRYPDAPAVAQACTTVVGSVRPTGAR